MAYVSYLVLSDLGNQTRAAASTQIETPYHFTITQESTSIFIPSDNLARGFHISKQ